MGELLEYFKSRYGKKESVADEQVTKTMVKNSIISLCDEYLVDVDSVLDFEVLPNELPYAVTVIEEEPLKSKYEINQVSKTMFRATLRGVEI